MNTNTNLNGVKMTEIKTLEEAIEEAYPIPDSPHTSVLMRAADQQAAFIRGWQARDAEIARLQAALADREAKQVQGELLPQSVEELLGKYWEIAHSEGATGVSRGDDAQLVLSSIRAAIAQRVGCGEPVSATFHHYGLSLEQVQQLLDSGLKPEEIGGADDVQHLRVNELVWWFSRLAQGNANMKWAVPHAYELAYFVATNGINRHIDLQKVKLDSFKEGVNITPQERQALEHAGIATPPAAVTVSKREWRLRMTPIIADALDGYHIGGSRNYEFHQCVNAIVRAIAVVTDADKRDAVRLDWLENEYTCVGHGYILIEGTICCASRGNYDLREAIDAAIAASEQEGK